MSPPGDYKVGAFGFVIDETRHAVYDGPSSFIGWRGRAGGVIPRWRVRGFSVGHSSEGEMGGWVP